MADPTVVSVKPVQQEPTVTKITYLGATPVKGEVLQSVPTLENFGQTVSREKQANIKAISEAGTESPERLFFDTMPYVAGGAASTAASAAGKGLLVRSLLAGLAGAAGEGGAQIAEGVTNSPEAPQNSQEAFSRMFQQLLTQGGLEFGVGAAMKPFERMLTGTSSLRAATPKSQLDNEMARLSRDFGLNLTPAEVTGSWGGRITQRAATSGLFAQRPALAAQELGVKNARSTINNILDDFIWNQPTNPQQVGRALQGTIKDNTQTVKDVFGGRVGAAAAKLEDATVNVVPLKQWAKAELAKAGVSDTYHAGQGASAAELLAAKSLGYKSVAEAKASLPQQAWDSIVQASASVAPAEAAAPRHMTKVLGRPDPTLEGILQDIVKLGDDVPFAVANQYKQDLRALNPNIPTAFGDRALGVAKTANSRLTALMENSILNHPAGQDWINARAQYREARTLFERNSEDVMGKFVENLTYNTEPSQVVAQVNNVDRMEALRDAILKYSGHGSPKQLVDSRNTWSQFQRQYVQGLLKAPEMVDPATGKVVAEAVPFDVYGLKARMDKVGAGTLSALFSTNPQALNNLRAVAEAMSRVQKLGGVNTLQYTTGLHTASALVGGVVGLGTHFNPIYTAGSGAIFESLPWIVSRGIYSKRATQFILRGFAGMAAEARNPMVAAVGRAGVKATPYLASAAANFMRAKEIIDEYENQETSNQGTQGTPLPIGSASPFNTSASK